MSDYHCGNCYTLFVYRLTLLPRSRYLKQVCIQKLIDIGGGGVGVEMNGYPSSPMLPCVLFIFGGEGSFLSKPLLKSACIKLENVHPPTKIEWIS